MGRPLRKPSDEWRDHLSERKAYLAVRDALDKDSNGAVLPSHANLIMILKRDPTLAGLAQFNSFAGLHMLRKPIPVLDDTMPPAPGPYPRAWDADDITRLLAYVQKSWAHNFKKPTVEECLQLEGRDKEVHDVRSYLADLKWDDTPRLDRWLTMTFGCPSDEYHGAVGSKLLIAAVRRVRSPGCKHDHLVVLEGPQGIGKSTAISILFGEWTADQISDLSSKDAAIDLRGKWGVELPEIEHLNKADIETVKAFLSRATDHYRPPYGKHAVDVPRQCVLIGTTNATEYLRDATGNRRFWPVKCLSTESADIDWLRSSRDQLWAEAAHREAAGEEIWLENAAVRNVAVSAQAARLSEDPWQDKVRNHITGLSRVTVPELFDHALFVQTVHQTKAFEMRVANILKGLGWEKKLVWDKATSKPFKAWSPQSGGG
jgi:predicted P-loop ATPase